MSTQLLLVVLAASIPALMLVCCGKMDSFSGGLAVVLALIIVWLGCQRFILRPLNALLEALRQAVAGTGCSQVGPAWGNKEFTQLAAAINAVVTTVRERFDKQRGSDRHYQQLIESMPEALWVQQADRIVLANPTAMNLLGATSMTQLADKSFIAMVHPAHREAFAQYIAQLGKGNALLPLEGKLLRLDGAAVDVEVAVAVVDHRDKPAMQFVARDVSVRKRTEQQLRTLSLRLLKVQDEERRRIARDLHDSTAQELASMMTGLGIIEEAMAGTDELIQQQFTMCRKLAEHCSKQIRTTAYLLHPPLLDELGLVAALKRHVEGFTERTNIRITLDLPSGMGRLEPETEMALFRVVQESLCNIHRHSGSSTATIRLSHDAMNIMLEVQDQGHGLSSAVAGDTRPLIDRPGVGIAGMQERLQHLGGRLSILSDKHGTTVRATLVRRNSNHETIAHPSRR